MVSDRHPRFGAFADATAQGVAALSTRLPSALALTVALAGCASGPFAAAPKGDFATRVSALHAELDALPKFDPARRAAEPALVALAGRIAADLNDDLSNYAFAEFTVEAAAPALLFDIVADAPGYVAPAAPATIWAVELGQFDDADLARALWTEIAAAAPEAARGLSPRVVARTEGVLLRAGPIEVRAEADARCAAFDKAGIACAAARFAGTPLVGAEGGR